MKAAAILSALALAAASPAGAAVYVVSFNSGLGAFSGTITTTPDPNPTYDLVTALTGTFGGNSVTLIAPGSFVGNDNLFSPTSPFVDTHGIAFSSGGLNYLLVNTPNISILSNNEGSGNVVNFTVQETTPNVPEPSTWAMMLLGFGAMGFAFRRTAPAKPARV